VARPNPPQAGRPRSAPSRHADGRNPPRRRNPPPMRRPEATKLAKEAPPSLAAPPVKRMEEIFATRCPRGRPSAGEEEIPPPPAPPELCPAGPAGGGRGGEEGGGCLDGLGFPPLPSPTGVRAGATKTFLFEPLRLYESCAF
jgi:hypothetical protein